MGQSEVGMGQSDVRIPTHAALAKANLKSQTDNLLPSIQKMSPRCPYCAKPLPTGKAVRQHVAASQSCSKSWEMHQLAKIPTKSKKRRQNSSLPSGSPPPLDIDICDEEMDEISHEFVLPHKEPDLPDARTPSLAVDPPVDKRAEDNDDQPSSHTRYSEAYPRSAGQPFRKEKTQFEKFRDDDSAAGRQPWEPFSNKKEWELATWIIKNVNQKATEQYLNLPIVSFNLL